MTTDGTPWWEVLGMEQDAGSALHRVKSQADVIGLIQQAFVAELRRISVRSVSGLLWATTGEFDDLVDAVHEAWRELGVSR